jgi:fructuronate reductase
MARLTSLDALPPTVQKPAYTPAAHGAGIVHIGFGAFHKAHQAVYTDEALAASGGDWRIIGVSLRSPGGPHGA